MIELTEAELKLKAELEATHEAWLNGTLKTYSHEEFRAMADKLIKELEKEQKQKLKAHSQSPAQAGHGNLAFV